MALPYGIRDRLPPQERQALHEQAATFLRDPDAAAGHGRR